MVSTLSCATTQAEGQVPTGNHVGVDLAKLCKEFSNLGGKIFNGTEGYVEARNWIRDTERIMDLLELDNMRRVRLAAWHLRKEASFWWESVEGAYGGGGWIEFKALFEGKFLSMVEEETQMEAFMNLKQGSMTAQEYVNKFSELSRFGGSLVDTPVKKAMRFVRGLNQPLQGLIASHIPAGVAFEPLVEMALMSKVSTSNESKEVVPEGKKNFWRNKGKGKKPNEKQVGGPRSGQVNKNNRCYTCGQLGHYSSQCSRPKFTGKCYFCGGAGHISKACPKKLAASETAKAQVQALEVGAPSGESEKGARVEGAISLFDTPIRALFDSGASHSFISNSLVDSLCLDTSLVTDRIIVSNPVGGTAHLTLMCKDLVIYILDVEFSCDAYVLGFSGYGIILGMDWLSSYGAIIDCDRRIVRLGTNRGRVLELACDPLGSVMTSFLYSLEMSMNDMSMVPVVQDYPDVFEEVRGLHPKREIEFKIYLVDNAKPVALPVRHMAPRERKELSRQVNELLEKGFIRRSISEWGHLLSLPPKQMALFVFVLIIES